MRSTAMQVKDLTTEELKALIRDTVLETIEDLLPDPDAGLTLKPEVRQQLQESLQRQRAGEKGFSAENVAHNLGISW